MKANRILRAMALFGVVLGGSVQAQLPVPAGDFPMFKGNAARTGQNQDPLLTGPGRANLRWYNPAPAEFRRKRIIRNNTYNDGGNNVLEGAWPNGTEANDTFEPATPVPVTDAPLVGGGPANASPTYRFAPMVPAVRGNPTQAQGPGRRVFEWRLDPSLGNGGHNQPGNYALYVWIPQGQSTFRGVRRPSARYYVYEILYGNGQRHVEIFDTYAGGRGWARIGASSNALFPYNGLLPIRLRLYNTNPRDESIVPPPNNPDADLMNPVEDLVYADGAMAVPSYGSFQASPVISRVPVGLGSEDRVVAAGNRYRVDETAGSRTTVEEGVVRSYVAGTSTLRWQWSPVDVSPTARTLDNLSAGVTNNGFGVSTEGRFQGTNAYHANVVTTGSVYPAVTYAPSLAAGEYEVYAYVGGNFGTTEFATAQRWEIREGTDVTEIPVDMSGTPRWVRLGTTRFRHDDSAGGDRLSVVATAFSYNASDAGRQAYADAVRFVPTRNVAITSTPVQVTARIRPQGGGAPSSRPVVIVPAEDGRIYCLDAAGNGDGTTEVLWAYPSLPDPNNASWTDPNHVAGEDGAGGIAEMPTGFGFTSAVVERIDGEDYLFIGSRNGRVYCIAMAGRGDFDTTTGRIGTTTRRWSFPSDYPSSTVSSSLGAFEGSVALFRNGSNVRVIVPARQGRVYALEGLGNPSAKTTDIEWAYPALNQPTLGPVFQTPAVGQNQVYFGTAKKDDAPGQFFALNATTGEVNWSKANLPDEDAEAYLGGPIVVDGALIGAASPVVFTSNQNGRIYSWFANTGADHWAASEAIDGGVVGPLSFTRMNVFNTLGVLAESPVVVVPTTDGSFTALFATASTLNLGGGRRAWQFLTEGDTVEAGLAIGHNWMVGVDSAGFVYAFNNDSGLITPDPDGDGPPGQEVIVENDPIGNTYRYLKVAAIPRSVYLQLRDNPTTLTRAQVLASAITSNLAFEWGETAYLVAYDFEYLADQNPVVNFNIGANGQVTRQNPVEGRLFAAPYQQVPGSNPPVTASGFAIYAFTMQGGGNSAMPPGPGSVSAQVTATLGGTDRRAVASLNDALRFDVANPIGIYMAPAGTSPNAVVAPTNNLAIGYSIDPRNAQNRVNGSPDVTGTGHNENLLATSVGQANHGQTGVTQIFAVDRSLMTLIRGPGRGLDGVRMERRDLVWQGGANAVINALNGSLFPGFEDLPTRFPNDSLDYPDVRRDQVRATRDLLGAAENPVLRGVELLAPKDSSGNDLEEDDDTAARRLVNTPFDLEIEFPRFQPANGSTITNSAGTLIPGGYAGRFNLFVDSNQNGVLDAARGRREAYRSFTLAGQVVPDLRLSVGTPTIDLGSLAAGAGYDPLLPANAGSGYSPWNPAKTGSNPVWGTLFSSLTVFNEGNVNLRNLRLAKGTRTGFATQAWPIYAEGNDELAWLDASVNVWSDFDANGKFNLGYPAVIQKARVGDRQTPQLLTNPLRRANPNLNVATETPLISGGPDPASPRVSATVPLGFPVGTYAQRMRVVEDLDDDQALALNGGVPQEPVSDPGFDLIFKVRETRLTNTMTRQPASGNPMTFPLVDDLLPAGVVPNYTFGNLQPALARDLKGDVVMAFVSNRPANVPDPGFNVPGSASWRIFLSGLDGDVPGSPDVNAGASPLRDLHRFAPGSGRWFKHNAAYPNGYPFGATSSSAGAANALFGAAGTSDDYVIGTLSGDQDTVRFGSPAFPSNGFVDPSTGSTMPTLDMAFLGEAQRQTQTGRLPVSRLLVSTVTLGADGAASVTDPVIATVDPNLAKGRPALVQTSATTHIFFAGVSNGQGQIYNIRYNRRDRSFTSPITLRMGNGFESMSAPSAVLRNRPGGGSVVELTFTGKLRGRPVAEVFLVRFGIPAGTPQALPVQTQERLAADREQGAYRARGAQWTNSTPQLFAESASGIVNIEVPGTRQVDASGVISFDTRLGGKVYLDPASGSVRFSRASANPNLALLLTYQPRILRVSSNLTASHGASTLLYDSRGAYRPAGDGQYWARSNNTGVTDSDLPTVDRLMAIYNRSASGNGLTARPYVASYRFGVQLPLPIHTQPNGAVTGMNVTGATSFYQVDPANGRLYFTAQDEGRTVSVTFTGIDANGQPFAVPAASYTVGLVTERAEAPLPIEQAVNEGSLTAFLDPMPGPRAGLVWVAFSSTRSGSPDLYLQGYAPRFSPVPFRR